MSRTEDLVIDKARRPDPAWHAPVRLTAATLDQVKDLHRLCREGKLYEVEEWIRQGRPLQLAAEAPVNRGWYRSALQIALESGQHSLALLLLSSGYRMDLEPRSPFDVALKKRREDLVDLLFEFGADVKKADPCTLFETYNSMLYERFRAAGFNLTERHELAACLGSGTSNRPLFGFVKRHRAEDPALQTELNMALGSQVRDGNERGVHLCLWAGADPHAPALSLASWHRFEGEDEGDDPFLGWSAIEEAVGRGRVEILRLFGPDPTKDDFDELYPSAYDGATIDVLAAIQPPAVVGKILLDQTRWLDTRFPNDRHPVGVLERVFRAGATWESATPDEIAEIRRHMLRAADYPFIELMRLLTDGENCSSAILQELARTPAMRERMKRVGFLPGSQDVNQPYRPVGARHVLERCGLTPPPQKPRLAQVFVIGSHSPATRALRIDRQRLYECVWSEPVEGLARSWGLSGPGLAKACRRLRIPLPPRGYWAARRSGKRGRRPRLPGVPEGEAVEIVVHVPPPRTRHPH